MDWRVTDEWPPTASVAAPGGAVEWPRLWVTYDEHDSYEADFEELRAIGVTGVEVSPFSEDAEEILDRAREHGMKLSISEIPDVTYHESVVSDHGYEPTMARMTGGAYEGQAIDRTLFSFAPEAHTIEVEEPVYDEVNCYTAQTEAGESIGRYYPELDAPVGAEVIVPEREYDGAQHLQVIPAEVGPSSRDHHHEVSFDLGGVDGRLDMVGLAVYYEYGGTDMYWMFSRGTVTPWAESTHRALDSEVAETVEHWRAANGGTFPEEVVAVRYGDENFYPTGHLNCPEASYPLWDYSEGMLGAFEERQPGLEPPRTWGHPEVYGPEAYADWLWLLHRGCANVLDTVQGALEAAGVDPLLYRNITRVGVFDRPNYFDGSGLGQLQRALDVAHLDPYPVQASGYDEGRIPRDTGYVAALARPMGQPVMPWMQAHTYAPGELTHPAPEQLERIVDQHLPYDHLALSWLKYPGSLKVDGENWAAAERAHRRYAEAPVEGVEASVAAVRSYDLWALDDYDRPENLDRFLVDGILEWLQFEERQPYDAFEVRRLGDLDPDAVSDYEWVVAGLGSTSGADLDRLTSTHANWLFLVEGADALEAHSNLAGLDADGSLAADATALRGPDADPQVWRHGDVHFAVVTHRGDPESEARAILDAVDLPAALPDVPWTR